MTIRRTLLTSYLLISLVSAMMITGMIVAHLRSVLRMEIEHKLTTQAATIMQQIDTTLFERLKNIATWSRLAVMQEVRIRDIDKRLARFLSELYDGYGGVYHRLFVVNEAQEVIASSRPRRIGERSDNTPAWLDVTMGSDNVSLHRVDAAKQELLLSVALPDDFQQGRLGRLFAAFDWNEIQRLLESPALGGGRAALSHALLVDNAGRVIAASADLQSGRGDPYALVESWLAGEQATGALTAKAPFLAGGEALIGYARSQGYRTFKGFGWRVLVLLPTRQAFAPVSQLWWTFSLFLCLTLLLGVIVSFWISARIAKPIVRLTEFTRNFSEGKEHTLPLLAVDNEIGELRAAFARMIESLEQSKRDLVRVAKLAAIGEMAAGIAHEVRTPLGILRSSAQMLLREDRLTDIGREMIEFIISEADRLNVLVTTLLDSARPRLPVFARNDLHRIIEHSMELLSAKAAEEGITLTTRFDAAESIIFCDRDQMIQVFLNLIMNAIQHTPEGGRVEITTRFRPNSVEVSVCDNGPGIPSSEREKVFEPFVTRREGGIGLGLTVVQQIVSAHEGRIVAVDNLGGGACFRVYLPMKKRI